MLESSRLMVCIAGLLLQRLVRRVLAELPFDSLIEDGVEIDPPSESGSAFEAGRHQIVEQRELVSSDLFADNWVQLPGRQDIVGHRYFPNATTHKTESVQY